MSNEQWQKALADMASPSAATRIQGCNLAAIQSDRMLELVISLKRLMESDPDQKVKLAAAHAAKVLATKLLAK